MIVFAGPSLAGVEDRIPDTIEIRPPARQGDVYLAAREEPGAIGLIDGYFEGVPSVWHKEILWALSRGIPVLGAASMGALRAAELDRFGMTGIGAIYGAYRDGWIEDDDEVALLHGPAEIGYPALSLAMVNVRATCEAALAAGEITAADADAVIAAAKAQFYKERSWDSVLAAVAETSGHAAFGEWVSTSAVDQKQADALALIECLITGDIEPPDAPFRFEETRLWVRTVRHWHRRQEETRGDGGGFRLLGDPGLYR